ncbi:hypothetical protein [Planctomycetes bacterium K23_9]|uniref:Uncharacterized protein n=1 Tax=Stieleria marina TaxID=1930275 RepID=A0A517NX79_9BACT|nr:hypothetical protein K239x_37080 [Planctomycetes bacterium K23_9]
MPDKILLFPPNQRDEKTQPFVAIYRVTSNCSLRCAVPVPAKLRSMLVRSAFLITAVIFAMPGRCRADDFLAGGRFYQQLTAPMSLVIQGKPFRATLVQVANQAEVNIWVDRFVDPSQIVDPGQLGPNVFAALANVAEQQNCVAMPVANVVLIGRADWVDATAAAVMPTANSIPRSDVSWEQLTTPRQALAKTNGASVEKTLALPHDLWPAVTLNHVQKPVAVNLILAQFGRRLSSPNQVDTAKTLPLSANEKVTRRYTQNDGLKSAIGTLSDPPALNSRSSIASIELTAKQHRILTTAVLGNASSNTPKRSLDERHIESLKIDKSKAGSILNQLAGVAKMKCIFAPSAQAARDKIISVDIKDKTLRQVIEIVAKESGLKVAWSDNSFQLIPIK